MTWRRAVLLLLVPLLAAGAYLWWQKGRPGGGDAGFETADVVRGTLAERISANGTINPVTVVNVGVQVSGTVKALHADYNDRVSAGQLLLELDPQLFRARLLQSEANLARARAQAQLAEANRKRAQELLKREFVSGQAYDQAVATAETAKAEVKAAEAAIAADRANLGFSVIRSPVSGVVISRQVDIGQTVAASFQTPTLFTIAKDLTKMQIEAAVAESDIGRVKVGQPVTFTVDAYGQRPFAGTVSQVRLNPTTQQNVVTFTVVISVDNPEGLLLPGMTVTASFKVKDHVGVLLIPNAALSFRPKDWDPRKQRDAPGGKSQREAAEGFPATIFVLGGSGSPEPRRVRIGASDDDSSIVLSGALKEGERVITGIAGEKKGGAQVRVRAGPPPS
jgi:HlyD family secretion protein